MNKTELIEELAKKADLSKTAARDIIDLMFDPAKGILTKAMKSEDGCQITGFGAFTVRKRAARKGINPKTGAKITIKARRVPVFKAGKSLKDAV